jgi:hypothetical protein
MDDFVFALREDGRNDMGDRLTGTFNLRRQTCENLNIIFNHSCECIPATKSLVYSTRKLSINILFTSILLNNFCLFLQRLSHATICNHLRDLVF